jgi:hypothetical protein
MGVSGQLHDPTVSLQEKRPLLHTEYEAGQVPQKNIRLLGIERLSSSLLPVAILSYPGSKGAVVMGTLWEKVKVKK